MSDNQNSKSEFSVLLGAAFLMATSAIGPGFLTQTATFTTQLDATFGFVILISVIMSYIAQLNVWKIICVSKMKGQDVANAVLPGLGYFVAFIVALGGLAFNVGNVGGAGLAMNVIFGLDSKIGAAISAGIAIFIFMSKSAGKAMDKLTQILGALMIIVILIVVFIIKPPVGEAIYRTFVPKTLPILQIVTLVGGTVGGYITFSGGHRLLDAGISGEEKLKNVTRSAIMGMGVATIVRILFFLVVFGVVSKFGADAIDMKNAPASAFQLAANTLGYKFFGIVLSAASLSSVVGAAYTSVSFLTSMSNNIKKNQNRWVILFIAVSTLIFIFIGKPAMLLIVAGSLNGLILPITLGAMLLASRNKKIVGENYKHSTALLLLGIIVVVVMAYLGIKSLTGITKLFA